MSLRRPTGLTRVVLPTAGAMEEFQLAEHVLISAGAQLKQPRRYTFTAIAEAIVRAWARLQLDACYGDLDYPRAGVPYDLFDQIYQQIYQRYASERCLKDLSVVDRMATRKTIMAFTQEVYLYVIPPLMTLDLTQYQLETLELDSWIGLNMVVELAQS